MKTQPLKKRLLIPLLLVEIAATGIGLSFPAQSTSLISSQGRVTTANPKPIHTSISLLVSQTLPSTSPTESTSPPPTAPRPPKRLRRTSKPPAPKPAAAPRPPKPCKLPSLGKRVPC